MIMRRIPISYFELYLIKKWLKVVDYYCTLKWDVNRLPFSG